MPFLDLYPLDVDHVGVESDLDRADTAVYRLVLRRLAVGGLPESVAVGDVTVHFIRLSSSFGGEAIGRIARLSRGLASGGGSRGLRTV
jgi:hypothetical protein